MNTSLPLRPSQALYATEKGPKAKGQCSNRQVTQSGCATREQKSQKPGSAADCSGLQNQSAQVQNKRERERKEKMRLVTIMQLCRRVGNFAKHQCKRKHRPEASLHSKSSHLGTQSTQAGAPCSSKCAAACTTAYHCIHTCARESDPKP